MNSSSVGFSERKSPRLVTGLLLEAVVVAGLVWAGLVLEGCGLVGLVVGFWSDRLVVVLRGLLDRLDSLSAM